MANTNITPPTEIKKGIAFTRSTKPETLVKLYADLEAKVDALNAVCNGDDLLAIRKATDDANAALALYNKEKTMSDYEDFLETSNPMKRALSEGYITLKAIRKKTDNDLKTDSYETVDDDKQIDFIAFNAVGVRLMGSKVKQCASQIGYMTLVKKGIGDSGASTPAEKKAVAAQITATYLKGKDKIVTEVFAKAPSNNEMKKAIQNLIDQIFYEDNGHGSNKFMVTSGWLHWFEDYITRTFYRKGTLGRSPLSTKAIIQAAAALYNAFFQQYGIKVSIDRENAFELEDSIAPAVEGSEPAEDPKPESPAEEPVVKTVTGSKSEPTA